MRLIGLPTPKWPQMPSIWFVNHSDLPRDYDWSNNKWGFSKIGLPPSHHPFLDGNFRDKPTILRGNLHGMPKPPVPDVRGAAPVASSDLPPASPPAVVGGVLPGRL